MYDVCFAEPNNFRWHTSATAKNVISAFVHLKRKKSEIQHLQNVEAQDEPKASHDLEIINGSQNAGTRDI